MERLRRIDNELKFNTHVCAKSYDEVAVHLSYVFYFKIYNGLIPGFFSLLRDKKRSSSLTHKLTLFEGFSRQSVNDIKR